MTHRMSSASSTVARALQMTAARAVSRGLEAVDEIFTRFTLLVPESDRKGQVSTSRASRNSKGFQARPTLSHGDSVLSPTRVPFQNCVIRSLSKFMGFLFVCFLDPIHSYSWLCPACGLQAGRNTLKRVDIAPAIALTR